MKFLCENRVVQLNKVFFHFSCENVFCFCFCLFVSVPNVVKWKRRPDEVLQCGGNIVLWFIENNMRPPLAFGPIAPSCFPAYRLQFFRIERKLNWGKATTSGCLLASYLAVFRHYSDTVFRFFAAGRLDNTLFGHCN